MTFDFAPGGIDMSSTDVDLTQTSVSVAVAPPCAPAIPTMAQVARLVEELFAEGSLSFEQLRSLSDVPELTLLLGDALAGVSAERRSLHKPR